MHTNLLLHLFLYLHVQTCLYMYLYGDCILYYNVLLSVFHMYMYLALAPTRPGLVSDKINWSAIWSVRPQLPGDDDNEDNIR